MQTKAQNVSFFSSKQGLSNSCIRSIHEDLRHNIWITSLNGLNRYDGVKINVYRHDDEDSTSLSVDESTCVLDYDKDHILVGTNSGLQMFSYATNSFSHIKLIDSEGKMDLTVRIINIIRLHDGKILICIAGYGCCELRKDADGNVYAQQIGDYNTGENLNPIQFYEDKQKHLWIINAHMQVYRQTGKGKYKAYPEFYDARKMCMSASGTTYLATMHNGLYRYNQKADKFEQVADGSQCGIVSSMNPWSLGRLFICTDGSGLRVYDETNNTLTQSTIQVGDFNIATSNVKDAIMDSFGNVWVGIYLKGVMMKPVSKSSFEYVGRHSITKNSLGTNSISAICPAQNGWMWVSTDNSGLYLLSPDGTSSQHITDKGTFNALAKYGNGVLLGSFFDGLYKTEGVSITVVNPDIKFIFDIEPAENGYYWIATIGQGIYYYNPSTNDMIHYGDEWNNKAKQTERIGNNYVQCIHQSGGHLFVGTQDGLNVSNVKNGHFWNNKKMFGQNVILDIAESEGKLWLASSGGLFALNIKTMATEKYTTKDGLPINALKSIVAEGQKLWIGTDKGLVCFDTKTHQCQCFFDTDGLQDNEFCLRAAVKANGKLYFGGISGLTYFDVKDIAKAKKNNQTMHLRLVDLIISNNAIYVGDKSGSYDILDANIDDTKEINLAYTDNHFSIQFTVDGVINQHITYEYSINGGAWETEDQTDSRLVFDNFEPGTYNIKVRARGFNMTSDERSIKVIVHAPWYASTLAKILYFLLALLLIWLAYEYTRRQIEARNVIMRHRQEKEINEARIQFFMNISHEIRTPMTLILAPLQKLISSDNDPERQRNYMLMKQNSNRILRLINQMMDVRKIEQGKFHLDYKKVDIITLLQNVYNVFITNAQNRGITYEFKHDADALSAYVDPDNLDKIVMNLLSNAFKFTPDKGKITLCLTTDQSSQFHLAVSDSGCGIKDEDKPKVFDRFYSAGHKNGYIGTGIGLNLTSMLVDLHKGNIRVEDNPEGTGTQFVIDMPMGSKSLLSSAALKEAEEQKNVTEEEGAKAEEKKVTDAEVLSAPVLEIDKITDSHNKKLVLVEDDDAIRQYVTSELSSQFQILECTNGQEAWDYIIGHPGKVNLIISDIMMPVMDGMTLCQKVKSNFNTIQIPIILMTALGSDADRIAGITNGADAYVSKPFNIDVLRSTALNLLKSRLMLQGKFNGEKQKEEHLDKVEIESPDEHLMKRVMKCINENIDNPDLSVEMIADKVGISRVHFYRKMKDLTGQSPRDFLKYVRLKEAARLIREKKDLDITGVSIAVGFKSLSSFSTNFKTLFGKSPTEYAKDE